MEKTILQQFRRVPAYYICDARRG